MHKGNLLAPLFQDKLFVGPELQYTSSRKTLAGRHTPGFVLANVTLFSQHLLKGLEVSASVYNLFNTHYGDQEPKNIDKMSFPRMVAVFASR